MKVVLSSSNIYIFVKLTSNKISTKNCVKEIIQKLRETRGQNLIKSITFYLRGN